MTWYKKLVIFRADQKEKIKRRAKELGLKENEYIRLRVDKDKK